MKILSITPFLRGAPIHPFSGGKSAASLKITNALVEEGHEVFVLPWSKEYIWKSTKFRISHDASYATALPTLYIPRLTDWAKNIFFSLASKKALKNPRDHIWKYIRESYYDKDVFLKEAMDLVKPDIVHIHYTHSDAIDYYEKLSSSVPVILTHHSNRVSEKVARFDYVVFVCKYQYDKACKLYPEVKQKSCYIHHCVSDTYFKPTEPAESNNILFLSRFKAAKGFQSLLDAFATDEKMNHYTLSAIGEGEMEDHYKKFAKEHNLDNVSFLGRLSLANNANEMEKASLFVMPSHGESFALTYIEALCMGLPVIGYPPNIREHNELFGMEVGYEFDASNESPQRLAELIDKAMNSNLTNVEYRKKLMEKARKMFSYDSHKENYMKVYEKIYNEN